MARVDDQQNRILFFDGVCNLCNSTVDFVIHHDPEHRFRFASLQSPVAQRLLGDQATLSSMVFLDRGRVYRESGAVLKVLLQLGGGWSLLGRIGWGVPAVIRDSVYRWIARHRYRFFGVREQCRLPTAAERAQFLND